LEDRLAMAKRRKRLKVGCVGLNVGRHHLRMYQECPEAEIWAICDLNKELLQTRQKEFSVPHAYTDLDRMLKNRELDAVSVAVGNALHAPLSIRCLEAGKHVLCEKPMACTTAEALAMAAAAKKARKTLMIHFNTRFGPEARLMHEIAANGELGQVYFARTGWHRQRGVPHRPTFTTKAQAGAGSLIDLGVHRLDLALWCLGYPKIKSVSAQVEGKFAHEVHAAGVPFDVDDFGSAYVRFVDGSVLAFEVSWRTYCEDREVMFTQLYGTQGGVLHQNVDGTYQMRLRLFRDEHGAITETQPSVMPREQESAQAHFVRAIIEGREPSATVDQALTVTRLLEAMQISAQQQREVLWEDLWGPDA